MSLTRDMLDAENVLKINHSTSHQIVIALISRY
jgi:hypothetical protein